MLSSTYRRARTVARPAGRVLRWRLLVVAAAAVLGCSGGHPTAPLARCTGAVAVRVATTGDAPRIDWTPACLADYVALGRDSLTDVWWVYRAGAAGIAPGVRVGAVPPGAAVGTPLQPLVRGVRYEASVGWQAGEVPQNYSLGAQGYALFTY